VNANDATLTALTPTKSSSRAANNAPNAPAAASFDLVLTAVAGTVHIDLTPRLLKAHNTHGYETAWFCQRLSAACANTRSRRSSRNSGGS
jgi:hypothetical protein